MRHRSMLPCLGLLVLTGCVDGTPVLPGSHGESLYAGAPSLLEVKFREPLRVRGDGVSVFSEAGADMGAVDALLARYGVRDVQPLFQASAAGLDQLAQAAVQASGERPPDLRSWYHLRVPAGVDAGALLAHLQALPEVEHAYRAPLAAPPPGRSAFATPSFMNDQLYFGGPPAGSSAFWAHSLAGGRGEGVMVVDLEYDWFFGHEDLQLTDTVLITGELYHLLGADHGTAVLGQLMARDNGFGVTGGVPNAHVVVASPIYGGVYRPADAIAAAAAAMRAGDVLLLEQQTLGPDNRFVPLEWVQSVFDATLAATMAGRIVVAAAGNGGEDLDDPKFEGRFSRGVRHSGAIIVGAGNLEHARIGFSTYGWRLDLQGLGQGVVTTGYGSLYGITPYSYYTAGFSGTSSASPIVTAAVAAIQGRRRARGLDVLTPAEMTVLLQTTGLRQTGDTAQHIGPFPNLRAALAEDADPVTAPATLTAAALSATVARLTWTPGAGHTGYQLQRRTRGADGVWGAWAGIAAPAASSTLFDDAGRTPGAAYRYQVRACSPPVCSAWTQSPMLTMPGTPAAPSGVTGTPTSATSIRVSWADAAANETRFTVERRTRPAVGDWSAWQQIATPGANATSHTDNGRTPGNSYLYRVNACNTVGCSAWGTSPVVSAPVPPAAPTTVRAVATSTTRTTVTWVDASGNETRFELARRARNADGSWGAWTGLAAARMNAVSAADSGLASGRSYQYQARACNGAACSPWAASPSLLMPTVPAIPTALRAASIARTGVALAWTDASANETSFLLQRRTSNTDGSYGPWITVARPPRNAVGHTDGGVAAGARYTWRLAACDGPACSGWSNAVGVTIP